MSQETADRWQRWFALSVFVSLLALGYFVVQQIKYEQRIAILNKKVATVAADALSVSDTALLMLDEHGKIVKSSSAADDMFANGHDIEGRNVHDWCLTAEATARAAAGMRRWYLSATPGTRRVLIISAKLPTGSRDLFVTVTALRREPGSDIKMMAFVNYMDQVTMSDIREKSRLRSEY